MKLKILTSILAAGSICAQDGPPPLAPLPKVPAENAPQAASSSSAAPADVVASAVTAVASLGDEVVLGRYQVAVERMNPQWKKRTADRMGGMDKLEQQLDGVAKQMVQQGISMISFKPQGQPRSYEVGPGKKVETVDGGQVETLVFSKWLVMIPTVTKFRIIRPGEAKPIVIESIGFQVAVTDKGKNDWTFIDGAGLTVNDLRSLYVNLPQDLQFPPLEKREAR
ncbi:hypothetical protein JIN84_20115 [Luteolibacter yonseiensis]|uniref:Uncharacterized protein n=1 Tax=Luteolibacter yonseiensis TaxID=1144680 RepID=A0A934R3X1_9BACT|nr:hypothetical protein [Luteolibacter yonseiensis]MBK1817938.1 hypothetical protein [Luteolibacter yonseiensis]